MRLPLASLVVAVLVSMAVSACGNRPTAAASPSPLKTFVDKERPFSVSYDPRLFVVDTRSDASGTLFVAKPRWPGQPDHFNANKIVWVNCVFISVSASPESHGEPLLTTKKEVREWKAAVRRWYAAHRVVVNDLVGTKSEDEGVEGSSESVAAPAKTITWDLEHGRTHFHVQLDCPTKYWPVWGPRMLAVVNSLQATK